MQSTITSGWRRTAALLRDEAPGLPVEGPNLLHAACILETAAASFEAREEAAMRAVFEGPPEGRRAILFADKHSHIAREGGVDA